MSLLLVTTYLQIRAVFAQEAELTSWNDAPNIRGTWDLIISCILTLTICVWSALHLNVPFEGSRLRQRNLRRAQWILLGIFAPELVVSTAFAQYLTARWLRREIHKDVKCRKDNGTNSAWPAETQLREWTTTQCYFAVMGGIRVETGDFVADHARLTLTAEGVRLLSFLGRLPDVPEQAIDDKSKADGLAKFVVVLQAGWMILSTLARVQQRLPVTLLEINTVGHVLCAFALYALWWSKPLEIKDPVIIQREAWMDKFLATMWMCSPISWHQNDFISEMRCMEYLPPADRAEPTIRVLPSATSSTLNAATNSLARPHTTRFSVGSVAAKDPMKFIGPLRDFQVGRGKDEVTRQDARYIIQGTTFAWAKEHEIFLQEQAAYPHFNLRHHRNYCRRALTDCEKHDALSDNAIRRWHLANSLVDELWTACSARHEYREFFFTESSLGTFVGEQIYIVEHVPNFPGLSYLGSVNVHRDILKSVLAFTGFAYGGLHLSAWNEHFPTQAERWLWISCSLATGATGFFLALFFLAAQKIKAFEDMNNYVRNTKALAWVGASILTPLFIVARVFIVLEAFISLRSAPSDIYKTPEWTKYLPHL